MTTDAPKDRLLGTVLDGRFRLDSLLGTGGMGKVYAGHQLSVERAVAVKVLREELSESESLAQRFFREAKVVASLRHANIVGLVDFGRDPERGLLYIAMEYVDGVSLAGLLRGGRIEAPLAINIARQICSALAEAHSKGVVHRDLKPDNVMLVTTAEGRLAVKVLDFGIALPTGEEARLTNTGAVVGTPHYMAPEQAQDHAITNQSDLYSLGVLLYEMLTGRLPFIAETPMAVLLKVITLPPPPLGDSLTADQMPPESLVRVLEQLLAKEPSVRPSDIGEVGRVLDEIARAEGLVAPSVSTIGALDALVVPRASDEFVFAATAASPAPTPSSNAAVAPVNPPTSTVPPTTKPGAKIPDRPRRSMSKAAWLLIPFALLCCVCGNCLRGQDRVDPGATSVPAANPAVTEADVGAVDAPPLDAAGPDLTVQKPDAQPAKPPSPVKPAPVEPAPPVKPPVIPGSSGPPKPAMPTGLTRGEGGYCTSGQCTYKGGPVACAGPADCRAACPKGRCSQTCTDAATCEFTCAGKSCTQGCFDTSSCTLTCPGGECRQTCGLGATCELSCDGGGCKQDCKHGDCTKKTCRDGDCTE